MRIEVNDEHHEFVDGTCLADVLEAFGTNRSGIAVAHNGEVIPQVRWDTQILTHGDQVLIIAAAQGG